MKPEQWQFVCESENHRSSSACFWRIWGMLSLCRLSVWVSDKHNWTWHPVRLESVWRTDVQYHNGRQARPKTNNQSLMTQETVANGCECNEWYSGKCGFCRSETSHSGFVITGTRYTHTHVCTVIFCLYHSSKKAILLRWVLTDINKPDRELHSEAIHSRSSVLDPLLCNRAHKVRAHVARCVCRGRASLSTPVHCCSEILPSQLT